MERAKPFNPLDKRHLGESVANALISQPGSSLPPGSKFDGAGIYAIYYCGAFPAYRRLTEVNTRQELEWPIYVGKAVSAGARKGNFGLDTSAGSVLFRRLHDHSRSIEQAENLNLADFQCRYLVVEDIWIPLAESLLIARFSPLWNQIIDGFGNHDPGKRRSNQNRSAWDVMHPGRPWAEKLSPHPIAAVELQRKAQEFLDLKVQNS
jgi:hypothetical protein